MWQKFWQHFLKDTKILEATREAIGKFWDLKKMDQWVNHKTSKWWLLLLEIWPGRGALTKYIKDMSDEFFVVEKDEGMKPYLKNILREKQIIWGDILTPQPLFLQRGEARNMVVVWNLPYYITSPILRKFFSSSPPILSVPPTSSLGERGEIDWDLQVLWWVFLIQKEVADKIKTNARKKSYLRWLLNDTYEVEYLLTVPPESFDPPPKVDSAVIVLHCRKVPMLQCKKYDRMLALLDIVSMYKRKTLGKIVKMRGEDLGKLPIKIPNELKGKRLEELDWEMMGIILWW